ncbi:MAG TPA: AAA family ATPase, partial [Polyangiaceae bacterium]
KPSNLFLIAGEPENVRILDFGIARKTGGTTRLTETGALVGTPGYMAPEQVSGARELKAGVDVFALGCVLFECLAGAPVFVGSSAQAVFANILSNPVPRLSHWLPSVPAGLDDLLARMMARDPFDRFPDASAVVLAISDVITDPSVRLSGHQMASVSVEPARTSTTVFVESPAVLEPSVVSMLEAHGGQAQYRAETELVALFDLGNAPETAKRGVSFALALLASNVSLKLAVASSRDATVLVTPALRPQQRSLAGVPPESGKVLVDAATAGLLGQSFQLRREGSVAWIIGPRKPSEASAGAHLGRARELAILEGAYSQVTEEHCARLVTVYGPAGIGKSRLIEAFVDRVQPREPRPAVLFAQADTPTGTSPFELARVFVRERHRALLEADETGRHFVETLTHTGFSRLDAESLLRLVSPSAAALPRAHLEPAVLADGIRCAWLSFVEAEVNASPLVLVAEDVHLADAASLRLLGAALEQMPDRSLLVVASTRSDEDTVLTAFEPERIALRPLRPQVAADLLRTLLPDAPPAVVNRLVEQGAGSPIRLRELARLVGEPGAARGFDAALDARISGLPALASRVLRCGSVFGLRFTAAGVKRLLGSGVPHAEIEKSLEIALRAQLLRELVDPSGDRVFVFVHALLRDTAYAQLPGSELKAAHRAAGTALAERPGADPSLVAWHFEHAEEQTLARSWFVAAAKAALVGGEPARAMNLLDAAFKCATDPEDLAQILLLRADAALAVADTTEAQRAASEALVLARPGTLTWARAAALIAMCAGQRGDNDSVARMGTVILDVTEYADAEATAARVICLCRAANQLFAAGRISEAQRFADEAARSSSSRPEAQAAVAHLEASLVLRQNDYQSGAKSLNDSANLYGISGNLRASALMRVFRASILLWAGDSEGATAELEIADGLSRRTGADYYVRWARYTRAKITALTGDPWLAREQLQSVRSELANNPRIVAGTHIHGALAAIRAGDGPWAEAEALSAMAAHQTPSVRAIALAALARSKVLQHEHAQALEHASEARALLDTLGAVEENESIVHLALPEALEATARLEEARPLAQAAADRLARIAGKLTSAALREAFLHENDTHAATLRLAHTLGVSA